MKQDSSLQNSIKIGNTYHVYYPHLKLGQGYAGSIYQGLNLTTKQKTAVKVMKDGESIQKFIKTEKLVEITNSNKKEDYQKKSGLVQVLQIIKSKHQYIVMKLCKQSLRNFLIENKSQLSQQFLINFTMQIVQGLITLKKNGFVYRDLKPQNILVTFQDEFKIGDLDSILQINNQKSKFNMQIFGTVQYMAPQVLEMGSYSQKGTIWSLGMILHQLIYKSLPKNNSKKQHQALSNVYKNLFDLQINKFKRVKLPLIHRLMESMLHLNEQKRIYLEQIIQVIQSQKFDKSNNILKPSSKQNLEDFESTLSSISQASEEQKNNLNEEKNNKIKNLFCQFLSLIHTSIQNIQTPFLKKKSLKLLNLISIEQKTLMVLPKEQFITHLSKNLIILRQQALNFMVFIKKLTVYAKNENQLELYRKELITLKMLQTLKKILQSSSQQINQLSLNKIIQNGISFTKNSRNLN